MVNDGVQASSEENANLWREFDVDSIPSKQSLHLSFEEALQRILLDDKTKYPSLLDLGCGDGRVALDLTHRGFAVTAVDVNESAVEAARHKLQQASQSSLAVVGDCCNLVLNRSFDCVLCQLLISIVGKPVDRRQMLSVAHGHLGENGILLLSASGASETINPNYAKLYARDKEATKEERTYFSRRGDGKVLYMTHHFTEQSLSDLLNECGFTVVSFSVDEEASSRRPEEKAFFFYVVAMKKSDNAPVS